MNKHNSDMITWGMMLRKLPSIARALPRVVRGVKAGNIDKPDQACGLGWSFEQATRRNPDGPALLCGERVLSYSQVNQWANRIAAYLHDRGIGKGDVLAIFIENRPELLVTVLAVAKLGGICAMLNTAQTHNVLAHSLQLVKPAGIMLGGELLA
ncbi:AMP-binding protein, partial [Pseudomonas sp. MWU12-2323]